ncbi:MAG: hypothetical protein V3U72_01910, partial [Candidatus Aenigmarchaeota archaeon]
VIVALHKTVTFPQEERSMLSEVTGVPTEGASPNIDTLEVTSSPIASGITIKANKNIPKITP